MSDSGQAGFYMSNDALLSSEDISVIMTVYNHEETISDALDSVLMQDTHYKVSIYCLDDASTDNSGKILKEYEKKYPDKIKVLTSTVNQGLGKKTIRHLLPQVKGKYWCLLPGDDFLIGRDKLTKQIDFLNENLDYVGCSCNSVMKNEKTNDETLIQPSRNVWNLLDLILLKHKYAFYVHTTSVVWRNIYRDKELFLPPLFRKESVYGDVMLMHLMLCEGGKVWNIPEVMSCYRVTGKGEWSRKSEKEQSELNDSLDEKIRSLIPLKYKIILSLQNFRDKSDILKKLILGPVNE